MPDHEVVVEFDKMLENMNLTDERKQPIILLPMSKKREMLTMSSKSMAAQLTRSRRRCNSVKKRRSTPAKRL